MESWKALISITRINNKRRFLVICGLAASLMIIFLIKDHNSSERKDVLVYRSTFNQHRLVGSIDYKEPHISTLRRSSPQGAFPSDMQSHSYSKKQQKDDMKFNEKLIHGATETAKIVKSSSLDTEHKVLESRKTVQNAGIQKNMSELDNKHQVTLVKQQSADLKLVYGAAETSTEMVTSAHNTEQLTGSFGEADIQKQASELDIQHQLPGVKHKSGGFKLKEKVIYGATESYGKWESSFNFANCGFKNCVVKSGKVINVDDADVVLFGFEFIKGYPPAISKNRHRQIWIIKAHESPRGLSGGFRFSAKMNGYFNATYTYRTDSDLYAPYGVSVRRHGVTSKNETINYAERKTKGAFAYVSNCDKSNYDRIGFMKELKKFIDVDIFGKCTNNFPCPRMDYACENKVHSQYRFYLSYENSLCKDYITEKFWSRLQSPAIFIPVALGGMTTSEYDSVAPPDSFLHYYNFSSTERLGKYLQYLMKNDTAYNRYHTWRSHYAISGGRDVSCTLCEMANKMPSLPAKEHLDEWFNNPALCRKVNL